MPLTKQLKSQCCPQQILDKQLITVGFWPPRSPDLYEYGYYLWKKHEIWINTLIARTVR